MSDSIHDLGWIKSSGSDVDVSLNVEGVNLVVDAVKIIG